MSGIDVSLPILPLSDSEPQVHTPSKSSLISQISSIVQNFPVKNLNLPLLTANLSTGKQLGMNVHTLLSINKVLTLSDKELKLVEGSICIIVQEALNYVKINASNSSLSIDSFASSNSEIEISNLKQEILENKQKLEDLTKDITKMNEINQDLQENLINNQNQKLNISAKLAQLKQEQSNERTKHIKETINLQETILTLKSNIKAERLKLSHKRELSNQLRDENALLAEENTQLQLKLQSKKQKISRLKSQLANLNTKLMNSESKIKETEQLLQEKPENSFDNSTQLSLSLIDNSEQYTEAIDKLNNQLELQSIEIQILSKKKTQLLLLFHSLNNICRILEARIKSLQSQNRVLNQKSSFFSEKLTELTKEHEELKLTMNYKSDLYNQIREILEIDENEKIIDEIRRLKKNDSSKQNNQLVQLMKCHSLFILQVLENQNPEFDLNSTEVSFIDSEEHNNKIKELIKSADHHINDFISQNSIKTSNKSNTTNEKEIITKLIESSSLEDARLVYHYQIEKNLYLLKQIKEISKENKYLKDILLNIKEVLGLQCDDHDIPAEIVDKINIYNSFIQNLSKILKKKQLNEITNEILFQNRLITILDRSVRKELQFEGDLADLPQYIIKNLSFKN